MILVDLVIIAFLAFSAYFGSKRGMVLIGLELASFLAASAVALTAYHPVGGLIKNLAGIPASLGNIAGLVVLWILVETVCALAMRFFLIPHITRHLQLSLIKQIGGGILNAFKSLIIIFLTLIVFAGLPLSQAAKRPVTEAQLPKLILSYSGQLQAWLANGLGHDLNSTLNFFTVPAEPENDQRIELGYTTSGPVDAEDEAAMLVMLNHERTTRGLLALTLNTKARAVARAYSTEMFAWGYFSHINLEGKSPFDRMRAGGVSFDAAGENLALAPTLQLAHEGLMNSPGHRANILSPNYRTVGIGIIDGGPYGLMVTQDFTD
jgi:uncharacterized protein YkwD